LSAYEAAVAAGEAHSKSIPSPFGAISRSATLDLAVANAAVRAALALLSRASSDWRNGDPHATGPLHWSVAVPAAREALGRALLALDDSACISAAAATDPWQSHSQSPGST
jgi:hypothetical protein